jgi:hypothetical protein
MKRETISLVTALLLFSASGASAQSAYAVVDLAPHQRAHIKDYVLKERVRPTIVDERISMGMTVPPNVELHPVPADWAPSLQRLLYFVSDDRVHFVDPGSRRVVLDIF